MMDSPASQTQSLSSQVVTSKSESSRSTKGSTKFASLRGIIRFPVKQARGGSISNASTNGTNMANNELGRSLSRSSSRQNHHNRSQSTNYTPPPSAFGNAPYGRHSMNLVMKPYMSQPMLGLGHTRDTDGHGTGSMDVSGDEDSSYSATPERSPVRREVASSAANLLRVAPWAVSTPSSDTPSHGTQTRAPVPQPTPGRSSQEQGTPVSNGTSSMASVTQKLGHSRKLSTHSISNAIVNTTQAGLVALGVKSRRTSVDEISRPQTSPSSNAAGRSQAPKNRTDKGQMARPSTAAGEMDSRPPAVPSKDPPLSNTTLRSTIRRTNAPSKPLPPEPVEPAISLGSTTSNARSPSSSISPPRSTTQIAEVTRFPNPETLHHPKSPTHPNRPPPRAPPTPNSSPKPGAETRTNGSPKDHAYIQVSQTTSDMLSQPTVKLSAVDVRAQDGASVGSASTARSRPPSGALAPAAASLTVSQNPTNKTPSSPPTSGPRSYLPTPKRSMTTGDDPLRLNLPPFNPRLTLHEYLESNSARLSPSVILRPPPLPLTNLPVLTTLTVQPSGSETDGSGQLRRSLSAAGTSRGVMKCMPALPMQGTNRGTRGHEEVDDMEDDDEDDMDEEGELEDTSTNLNSASTGRMSMDSQTSTDDASSENLPAEQDPHGPSSWSHLGHRISGQSLSRSSSYQTALTGDEYEVSAVEPSPISPEPYYGNPNRQPDKRFSRAPHLARVDTSGLQLDFSVWDQKFTPKTPKPVGSPNSALAPSQEQRGSWNHAGVDKGKGKVLEGAGVQLSEGEIGGSFLANGEVFRSAFSGTEKTMLDRGRLEMQEDWRKGGNVDVRVHSEAGMAGSRHSAMEFGSRLEGETESSDHLNDVTESTTHITAAVGTSASPKGGISSLPGRGLGMDYFVYRNSPQHPPLGSRRDSNRSQEAATSSDATLPDMTPTTSTTPIITSITTNSTTIPNITRGASPLRTPRPADYRLSVAATTPPLPMSPLLSGMSPLVPSKFSEARLSVTMGNLGHRGGLYKIASRSLIDVHEIEMKEKVEKMVEDAEDAAERELKARKRSMKRSSVQAKAVNDVSTPKVDPLRIDTVHRRVSQVAPNRDIARTTPHSADPVMAGATKRVSMFSPVVFADLTSPDSPSNDEIQSRRISAAPAYDTHLHLLRRRRSMPTFNPSTAPPPYPDFSPYGVKSNLIIQPRDDEGAEKLPAYSNNIHLRAVLPRKMEFSQPGVQAKDRKWRKVLCVLDGTAFKVYKLPSATGVSAIGEWWENKIGAGDVSESTHHQTAGGTSGFRITTNTSQLNVAVTGADSLASGEDRKRGEGGETGAPILQRNNSTQATQSSSLPPHSPPPAGHHPGPSLAVASTKSALTLAVQLLKPSPRSHARSNSDVSMSPSHPRSPRASLNISRSERTTPVTSPPRSSFGSRSPPASTHLTTPSSSSTGFSRPTTPSSSISVGASTSSRAGQRASLNTPRSQNQSPSEGSSKGKSKEKNDVPEPDDAELMRAYTMQHAESGLGKDYLKRQHVIRVRLEGEQFLLQAPNVDGVIAWIEGLQAAANVALDLDDRPMPAGPIFPRRRRRRRPAVLPGFETNNNNNANADVVTVSPTIPNGPLSGVRPLERAAGRRT